MIGTNISTASIRFTSNRTRGPQSRKNYEVDDFSCRSGVGAFSL